MKKNLFLILSILVFSVSFVACNSDDNDDSDTNSFRGEFYLDNEKQDISDLLSTMHFDERNAVDDPEIRIAIFGENDSKRLGFLLMTFSDIDYYSLKGGDDLIHKSGYGTCMLSRKNDNQAYGYKSGTVKVKSIDVSKKWLEIEIDITFTNEKGTKNIIGKGYLGNSVVIEEYKP